MSDAMKRLGLLVTAVLLAVGGLTLWQWNVRRVIRKEVAWQARVDSLSRLDSQKTRSIARLELLLDSASRDVADASIKWLVKTERIPVPAFDSLAKKPRIEYVYKDSTFAALPDSLKVEVLRVAGERLRRACVQLQTTCDQYRDSVTQLLQVKDSRITELEDAPARRHGRGPIRPGCNVGYGAVVSAGELRLGPSVACGVNVSF